MKASTINKTRGASNIVKGETKKIVGKLTRNRSLQAKGATQEIAGKIQRAVGKQQKTQGD